MSNRFIYTLIYKQFPGKCKLRVMALSKNTTQWRVVDFWKYELAVTLIGGMVLWMTPLYLGIILGVYMVSSFPIYSGFATGVALFLYFFALQTLRKKGLPTKVGYDETGIHYIKGEVTNFIDFSEIERLEIPKARRGYIGATKNDGEDLWFGPGCGGDFGNRLLESYRKCLDQHADRKSIITETKKYFQVAVG